jgi:hypothetical protein
VSGYFEIQHVSKLLATSVLRLNKLALRCKIDPSLGGGGEKGSRRHFSVQDVCRLGVAVWLSNAGLRGPAISDVLSRMAIRHVLSGLHSLKDVKAEAERHRLLVGVDFRGRERGYQEVMLVRSLDRAESALGKASGVVVPLGDLLGTLAKDLITLTSM